MRRISGLLHKLATRRAGLSLMELTVVAAILALLAALTAVAVTGSLGSTTAIVKQNDEAEVTKAATSFSGIHPESFFPVTLQNRKPKVFQLAANVAQQLGVGDGGVSVAVFEIDWDACDDGTSGVCSKPAKKFAPDYIKKPQHADLPSSIDTDSNGVPELRVWVIVESTGEAKVLVPSNLYGSDRAASASAPTPTLAPPPTPTPAPAPTPPPTPTPQTATLEIRVTDAPPEGVSKFLVTVRNIEVNKSSTETEAAWLNVLPGPRTFDLVTVNGIEELLISVSVPPARYNQVRFEVTDALITHQGVDKPVVVPSGKLRFIGGFDLVGGTTTVVTVDFDAARSIVIPGTTAPPLLVPAAQLLARPATQPLTAATTVAVAVIVTPHSTPTPAPTPVGWLLKAAMPQAGHGASIGVSNGKIDLAHLYNGQQSNHYRYDPATNTWLTPNPAFPPDVGSSKGSEVVFSTSANSDVLYEIGGVNCCVDINTVYAYTYSTNSWTTVAPQPQGQTDPATGVINGKIYVAGGYHQGTGTTGLLNTLQVYDPVTNTWSTKAPMSMARRGAVGAVVNNLFYVIGGENSSGPLSSGEVYDPATNTWSPIAPMSIARITAAGAVVNNRIYVMGGYTSSPSTMFYASMESYDPATNLWMAGPSMSVARSSARATAVGGVIYVFGGYNPSGELNSVEAFTPTPAPTPTPVPTPTPSVTTAPTLIATVTVPASPRLVAVNSVTHRAYVAVGSYPDPLTYFVSVIDGATNIADIPVGSGDFSSGPIFTAVNETTNRVYVNHTGSNFASVINGSTNTRIATIGTGSYPEGIAADPTRDRLYIANTNSGNIQVINTAGDANTLLQTITVPGSGAGITNLYLTLIPATNRIFVTAPGLNKIVVIDGDSGTVTATFLVADSPRMIAADPATNRLYVTRDGSPSVLVLDATNGSTVATIPVGGVATHVAVNPTTHRIYATTAAGLKVIDGVTNTVSATVTVSSLVWVAVDTSNGRVYITTTNSVMVLQD